MLVIFVGCSGVGKNTIINDLIERNGDKYDLLPTYTTRDMREGEYEGHPYYFISEERFQAELEAGMIYEHQRVHDGVYGGSRAILEAKKQCGKTLLKDIDVLGADTLRQVLSAEMRVFSVFLYVKDENKLLERLRMRGEKEDRIALRRQRFNMEMGLSPQSDYMINNESREATVRIVDALINSELARAPYRLAAGCACPSEAQVRAYQSYLKQGNAPERAELKFNGTELLITSGADRYAAATRERAFIQKHIADMPDERLSANEAENGAWSVLNTIRE